MSIIDRMFIQIAAAIESLKSEEGQGMVEYGLILALIAVVCAVAFKTLGTTIASTVNGVVTSL